MAESPARAGPTLLTTSGTTQTIYTAGGAGTWAIVRSAVIHNVKDTVVKVTVGIGTSNTDATSKRIASVNLSSNETRDVLEQGFIPLIGHASTPDLIYAFADTSNGATVTIGLITGP